MTAGKAHYVDSPRPDADTSIIRAAYEIMRQASYLPRWSLERGVIEQAASAVIHRYRPPSDDRTGS